MKKVVLSLIGLVFVVSVYADVSIQVNLTDEQYKAVSVLPYETPEEVIQRVAEYKADRMMFKLIDVRSDKKFGKMTGNEKKDVMDTVDVQAEKNKRKDP